ncbi:hypothetical protein KKC97_04750 [bacterium]|nr:hypothetical protein [bacterium]MBU1636958.1 hypothetical protein [bacterium]MBU1920531.1 hypothetical protein [bacterium]
MGAVCFLLIYLAAIPVQAHQNHPSDSLSVAASKAYADSNWLEAARLFSEAITNGVDDSGTVYNCACCFALSDQKDNAFRYLDLSIEKGFTNVQHLQRDTDLTELRKDERWPDLVRRMSEAQVAYLEKEGIHTELFFMMKGDQAARLDTDTIPWDSVAVEDARRLNRVKELVAGKELKTAQDYFNAALICQHGTDSTDYRLANELAKQAAALDTSYAAAKWLSAASWDRYLQSMGLPQIYGTQFRTDSAGVWTLEPIDTTAVTDEERARLGVPSLEEARRQAARMNLKGESNELR